MTLSESYTDLSQQNLDIFHPLRPAHSCSNLHGATFESSWGADEPKMRSRLVAHEASQRGAKTLSFEAKYEKVRVSIHCTAVNSELSVGCYEPEFVKRSIRDLENHARSILLQ